MRRIFIIAALAALSAGPTGCTHGFDPWGDESTLVMSWTIDGAPADATACDSAGATLVRMAINDEPVDWFDPRLEWTCGPGEYRLDSMLSSGFYYLRWDLIDEGGEVVASTDWRSLQLDAGVTTIDDIDFVTH